MNFTATPAAQRMTLVSPTTKNAPVSGKDSSYLPPTLTNRNPFPIEVPAPSHLKQFLVSLQNHFRATPALIRYGASVCLHAAVRLFPSLLTEQPNVLVPIITGALDEDQLTAFLYRLSVESIPSLQSIKASQRFSDSMLQLDYDTKYAISSLQAFDAMSSEAAATKVLTSMLEAAVKLAPAMSVKALQKIIGGLEYIGRESRLKHMETARLWCSKLDKVRSLLFSKKNPEN
jgi:hypothetical protein